MTSSFANSTQLAADIKCSAYSALLTDYYQFTMAYGYWQLQRAETEAVFQLTFRKNPLQGNYTVACGLADAIAYLENYCFTDQDITYLASLRNPNGHLTFAPDFLEYLKNLKFTCDIDAIPEGTVVFPQEPLLRIKGPLLQCQLLETPLINLFNFSTLVATHAAQICQITKNDPVMEFGLRRAQGPNGGLTASRATFIGGCESTSNVLAGQAFNIPVKGTMAHSWVMSFPDELTAFREFVKTSPVAILLIDTYDSLQGLKNALIVGKELRQQGRDLIAVRLDSGDLATLSKKIRVLLDKAGFSNTKIIASGDLTAAKIKLLKVKRAPIDIWGVGTKLVTAYAQPSLDAIYKLTAIQGENKRWEYKIKLSDAAEKMTYPGILQVRRYFQNEKYATDIIYDTELGIDKIKTPRFTNQHTDLLVPIFRQGKLIYQSPKINDIQTHCRKNVAAFVSSKKKNYQPQTEQKVQRIRDIFSENGVASFTS